MKKSVRDQEPQGRPPLSRDKQQWAFAVLFRDVDCATQARSQLSPELFSISEQWLWVLWMLAERHLLAFKELPSKPLLLTMINDYLTGNPTAVPEGDEQLLDEFITFAFGIPEEDLHQRVAMTWLQQFLQDRLVDKARDLFSSGQTPVELTEALTSLVDKSADLTGLSGRPLPRAFATGWELGVQEVQVFSTGRAYLDYFMKAGPREDAPGGHAPKESYGILGPFGGGKTTMGVEITVENAKQAAAELAERRAAGLPDIIKVVYHVSYEAPLEELHIRALSYLAQIPRDRLTAIISEKAYHLLGGPDDFQEYERELFGGAIGSEQKYVCERQRFENAIRLLNTHWRPVDMTGSSEEGRGHGLTGEIASVINQDLVASSQDGVPHLCSLALVDYVLAAVEKHLMHNDLDRNQMRHYVNRFPLWLKYDVGIRFECPVWSLHQLNTQANSFKPNRPATSTDAAEGRAFAENLDFLFIIGKADAQGYARLDNTKHRRCPARPHRVLRLDGALARFIDCSTTMSIDTRTGSAVSRAEYGMVDGARRADNQPPAQPLPTRARPTNRNAAQSAGGAVEFMG